MPRNQNGGNHRIISSPDFSSPGVTPDNTGNNSIIITRSVTAVPWTGSEIRRNRRSPSTASSTPCNPTIKAAENNPPAATATTSPATKRHRLGGSAAMGSTTGARTLASKRNPITNTPIAPSRARNTRRAETGSEPRTKTSKKSGKNKSHSKTVISPIATNEYITKKK